MTPILLSLILAINPICKIDEKPCQGYCIKEYERCYKSSNSHNVIFESDEAFQLRKRNVQLGLIIPSLISFGVMATTLIVARKPLSEDRIFNRNICTAGNKNCGKICIPVEYNCNINDSDSKTYVTKTGWIVSGTFFAIGLGLLIATLVVPTRMNKKQFVSCGPNGCSFEMRF